MNTFLQGLSVCAWISATGLTSHPHGDAWLVSQGSVWTPFSLDLERDPYGDASLAKYHRGKFDTEM